MASLPSGTVAFLFSDIEGSTRLSAVAGTRFPELLDAHFALMREAIEPNAGTIVSTEGDSVFAVLPTARAAVAAAAAAQRALSDHAWPEGMAVRVRIGLHVGEALFGGRDYTGVDVNKAARVMAAAWGDEIICSQAVQALVGETVGDGVVLRDLGVHSLRDIADPERLYQVVVPGLRADFPPPRTESAAARTNLPTPLTRFVGRARELHDVGQLIAEARLVTLTGPGGTGKTRLAIEVGRASLAGFPDGVFFVALDAVRDADLVMPQIAQTLGLVEDAARPIDEIVAAYLAGKRLLLILDNLEQVITVAPRIAALVGAAPTFVVLGSSREALGVAGENVHPVPPLSLPSEPGHPTAQQVAALEAVELFVERARAARPDFALTDDNASAIAAICRRVDGLPLAIELAAARVNVLAPAQILDRLDHRLTLLAGSRRDVSDRQRTLRGAIDWSYDLLSDEEKAGFRRFAVFAGGADLDAVLAVLDPTGALRIDSIDLLSALVARSLLRSTDERAGSRFAMLETIREYALEQLVASDEDAAVHDRHAAFYAESASGARGVLFMPNRDEVLDRLDRDMPNFRAAIEWVCARGDSVTAATIAVGLKDFWRTRNHLAEARRLIDGILDTWPDDGPIVDRAHLLGVGSELASWQSDYARSGEMVAAEIALLEQAGDKSGLAQAYVNVGWSLLLHEPDRAREAFERALALAREVDDRSNELASLQGLGLSYMRVGDLENARRVLLTAVSLEGGVQDEYTSSFNILTLGAVELRSGNHAKAARLYIDALRRAQAADARIGMVVDLEAIAGLLVEDGGDLDKAAALALVAERTRRELGGAPSLALVGFTPPVEQVRELDPSALERASAEIANMTLDQAIALAFSVAAAIAGDDKQTADS